MLWEEATPSSDQGLTTCSVHRDHAWKFLGENIYIICSVMDQIGITL